MGDLRAPIIRWAGSKRQLVPYLSTLVPAQYSRYVEPFAGSMCLALALEPQIALVNDLNRDLITTYRTVREHPEEVHRVASSWDVTKDAYYSVRSLVAENLPAVQRAARFIYLNRYCFNGVYRTDKMGRFNVPKGIRTGSLPPASQFIKFAEATSRFTFSAGDYVEFCMKCQSGDFVYLDPPYTSSSRKTIGEYGPNAFSDNDLPELLAVLDHFDRNRVKFLLSYKPSPAFALASESRRKWVIHEYSARRHVAGFARFRQNTPEVAVTNYGAVA